MQDQAEGLRRLFVADVRRMVAVLPATAAGAAAGRRISAGLATSLARHRHRVLLLDESITQGERHPDLGVQVGQDMTSALLNLRDIDKAIVRVAPGLDFLAGGNPGRSYPRPRMEARIGAVNALYRLAGSYDVVLVDAGSPVAHGLPGFSWACQDVIVLCHGEADAMTKCYAHIKALHDAGERRFHVLFSGVAGERAQLMYRNLATVSRRHLQVMPAMLGVLPAETPADTTFDSLAHKLLGWPLPERKGGNFPALMRRLLGQAGTPAGRTT